MLFALLAVGVYGVISAVTLREDAETARQKTRWGIGAMAAQFSMSESRTSKQLNGHLPLTLLAHAWKLGDEWYAAFCSAVLERLGYVVIPSSEMAELVDYVRTSKKRMAKAGMEKTA